MGSDLSVPDNCFSFYFTLNITVYVELRRDYLRFSRTVQEYYNRKHFAEFQ